MKEIYINDIKKDSKLLNETLEGKNINFIIGAGASMPYLKTLSLNDFNFEDLFDNADTYKYDEKVLEYLSAYFITKSLMKGIYSEINNTTSECELIKENYINFIDLLYKIVNKNSIQQPKRVNIFL